MRQAADLRPASSDGPSNQPTAAFSPPEGRDTEFPRKDIHINIRVPEGLTQPKVLAVVSLLVAVAIFVLWYLPSTPSYAVYELYSAIGAHDGAAAASYIDWQAFMKSLGSQYAAEQQKSAGANDPDAAAEAALENGILSLFSGALGSAAKTNFEQTVDQPNWKGTPLEHFGLLTLVGALSSMRRDGNMAFNRERTDDGKEIEVAWKHEDGRWRVTSVSGPAVTDSIKSAIDQQKKAAGGITPTFP